MATTTRQRLAGGFVLGVAAVAFYIGMQFNGPGLGGSGSGDGGPVPGDPSSTAGAKPPESELVGDTAILVSTSAPAANPSTLVAVVITGSEYLLSPTGDVSEAVPAELAEVVRSVLSTTGDGQGIRVRVFRKKDATTGAQADLSTKLGDVGIPSEEIQVIQKFLD